MHAVCEESATHSQRQGHQGSVQGHQRGAATHHSAGQESPEEKTEVHCRRPGCEEEVVDGMEGWPDGWQIGCKC